MIIARNKVHYGQRGARGRHQAATAARDLGLEAAQRVSSFPGVSAPYAAGGSPAAAGAREAFLVFALRNDVMTVLGARLLQGTGWTQLLPPAGHQQNAAQFFLRWFSPSSPGRARALCIQPHSDPARYQSLHRRRHLHPHRFATFGVFRDCFRAVFGRQDRAGSARARQPIDTNGLHSLMTAGEASLAETRCDEGRPAEALERIPGSAVTLDKHLRTLVRVLRFRH